MTGSAGSAGSADAHPRGTPREEELERPVEKAAVVVTGGREADGALELAAGSRPAGL
jgi:hypothetical protein